MLVRITNWEDPDQVQQCLSRAFWPATSVQNFRASTVLKFEFFIIQLRFCPDKDIFKHNCKMITIVFLNHVQFVSVALTLDFCETIIYLFVLLCQPRVTVT